MGRADIAILSNISVGIRLCLHPPALLMGGSAYDGLSLFLLSGLGFLSRHVGTCRVRGQLEPSHHAHFLRAQSLRGHTDWSFYLLMKTRSQAPTGPPYGRTAEPRGRARFSKHPPGTISRPGADTRCREMFKPSLSFPSIRLEVPLWSEHLAVSCVFCVLSKELLCSKQPNARLP
jgi:hypothetical protein